MFLNNIDKSDGVGSCCFPHFYYLKKKGYLNYESRIVSTGRLL